MLLKEQYDMILRLLSDGECEWHKTVGIADKLELKGTRAREILRTQRKVLKIKRKI